jgi:DNA-binding NarL/FixJ family response regulator
VPRVLIADDHMLVRHGIRALLASADGVEVVAEASGGREAIELALSTRPDVILMDVHMPDLNGLECTARIVKQVPGTRVLILSVTTNEEYVAHALRAGASGYLLKDADRFELLLAINAVHRGETYFSPAAASSAARLAMRGAPDTPALTPRLREILQLVALGASTKDIAARLNLSVKTVESHRAELMNRLGIRDVAGLVRYAIRTGVISPDG